MIAILYHYHYDEGHKGDWELENGSGAWELEAGGEWELG
jgi:hypothetical protein